MPLQRKITDMFQKTEEEKVSFEDAEKLFRLKKLQEDLGKFEYGEEGFIYRFEEGAEEIKWSELYRIVGYRADQQACMDLYWKDWKLGLSESTPGWYMFLVKLKQVFPGMPDSWEGGEGKRMLYEREEGE